MSNVRSYEDSFFIPLFSRAVYHWFTKNSDNMLKGLKLNLQSLMGMKLPNGLLNFVFKHTYVRKVGFDRRPCAVADPIKLFSSFSDFRC